MPGPSTGAQDRQSKFVLQKLLALLDFSDLRASKRSWALVSSPGSREWHQNCPQVLSAGHPAAQGQQQAGPLPPSSHAGELESPKSEDEAGNDWEESAPSPEQQPSAPRGERCLGQAATDSPRDSPRVHGPASSCRSWTRPKGALGGGRWPKPGLLASREALAGRPGQIWGQCKPR